MASVTIPLTMRNIISQPPSATADTVSALEARQQFGQLLDQAYYQGNTFLVQRAGKEMAALVPISVYRWMQIVLGNVRRDYFEQVDEIRRKFADLDENEVEAMIAEAVSAVRAEKASHQA